MPEILADVSGAVWLIAASELIAIFLLVRIWRSSLHWLEKAALTVLALIPVFGQFFAWWMCHDPGPAPRSLQDRRGMSLNVYDRWREILEEPDPEVRKKKARAFRDAHPGD